jgi:putative ubiquitin-RnfH superfamily antitoxin RatB of RatAB toxin-antitoxin module
MADTLKIEVAYAESGRQFLRRITLPSGATVADAIAASGLEAEFAIDVSNLAAGVWSKAVARDTPLNDGDRVEIYRPLIADPKEARRRRASRSTRQP